MTSNLGQTLLIADQTEVILNRQMIFKVYNFGNIQISFSCAVKLLKVSLYCYKKSANCMKISTAGTVIHL